MLETTPIFAMGILMSSPHCSHTVLQTVTHFHGRNLNYAVHTAEENYL